MDNNNIIANNNLKRQPIQLIDYIKIVYRWRISIIIIVLVTIILTGLIHLYFINPTYEAYTTIEIISSSTEQQFINVPTLAGYEMMVKGTEVLSSISSKLGDGYTLEDLNRKITTQRIVNTDLIKITVRDDSPEKVIILCREISSQYKNYVVLYRQTRIKQYSELLQKQIENEENKLNNFSYYLSLNQDNSINKLLESQFNQQQVVVTNLKIRKSEVDMFLKQDALDDGVKTISEPITPQKPIKPDIYLNIFLAGIFALGLSIFFAFFIEYLKCSTPRK